MNEEIEGHFDVIDCLTKQHGLNSMDFDIENVQLLISSISDLIKQRDFQKRIV
jgi:hypothetical protein